MLPYVQILPNTCRTCGEHLTRFHESDRDDEVYCLRCAAKGPYDDVVHQFSGLAGEAVTPEELEMRNEQLRRAHLNDMDG
ncbi:MAG: hypothetical protein H0X25_23450 [Acidobacteriales bacterium]|nr:hypothetical protein [Terriglobales bacterium]